MKAGERKDRCTLLELAHFQQLYYCQPFNLCHEGKRHAQSLAIEQSSQGYLANAAAAPSWGKISDIFGRKPVLLTAVSIFWIGSLICGLSHNMGMLIAGRAIQGIGGGGSLILVNICISDMFSVRKRGVYLGFVGLVWAVAGGFGPGMILAFSSSPLFRTSSALSI